MIVKLTLRSCFIQEWTVYDFEISIVQLLLSSHAEGSARKQLLSTEYKMVTPWQKIALLPVG